ncbi:ABC transporter permease [Serinibacter salmoneus]|uniref:ABC transporter permease n=1 Tax=Serinibacter salmoneus TaxID=556530 RepID=UPI000BF448F2|nr:ABC transporter permease [Serinibacter salmoneus]
MRETNAVRSAPARRSGRGARRGRRLPPWQLLIPGALGFAFLTLPLIALIAQAPWADLAGTVTSAPVVQALGLSLRTAASATVISVVLGVPLAWLLARGDLPGAGVWRAVVTLPMVLPPVVGGVALLALLGRRGLLGGALEALGITLPFTTAAVVLAQTFVAMPFLVLSVEGALRGMDRRDEQIAATLGASTFYAARRITLPAAAPAIVSGAVLCFARALGEFGATITFAGNFPGTTRTMPIAIYLALEQDQDAAIAMALLLMVICAVVLIALRSRWLGWWRR